MGLIEITEYLCSGMRGDYSERHDESADSKTRLLAATMLAYSDSKHDSAKKQCIMRCYQAVDTNKTNNNNKYQYPCKVTFSPQVKVHLCKLESSMDSETKQENYVSADIENSDSESEEEDDYYDVDEDYEKYEGVKNDDLQISQNSRLTLSCSSTAKPINILEDAIHGYQNPSLETFEENENELYEDDNDYNYAGYRSDEDEKKTLVNKDDSFSYKDDEETENKMPSGIYPEKYARLVHTVKSGNFKNMPDLRKLRCPSCRVGFRMANCSCVYYSIIPSPLRNSFVADNATITTTTAASD